MCLMDGVGGRSLSHFGKCNSIVINCGFTVSNKITINCITDVIVIAVVVIIVVNVVAIVLVIACVFVVAIVFKCC